MGECRAQLALHRKTHGTRQGQFALSELMLGALPLRDIRHYDKIVSVGEHA
jgi:hypothetical protein